MNFPSEQVTKTAIDGAVAVGSVTVWWQYTIGALEAFTLFGAAAAVALRLLTNWLEYRRARRNDSKGE